MTVVLDFIVMVINSRLLSPARVRVCVCVCVLLHVLSCSSNYAMRCLLCHIYALIKHSLDSNKQIVKSFFRLIPQHSNCDAIK